MTSKPLSVEQETKYGTAKLSDIFDIGIFRHQLQRQWPTGLMYFLILFFAFPVAGMLLMKNPETLYAYFSTTNIFVLIYAVFAGFFSGVRHTIPVSRGQHEFLSQSAGQANLLAYDQYHGQLGATDSGVARYLGCAVAGPADSGNLSAQWLRIRMGRLFGFERTYACILSFLLRRLAVFRYALGSGPMHFFMTVFLLGIVPALYLSVAGMLLVFAGTIERGLLSFD